MHFATAGTDIYAWSPTWLTATVVVVLAGAAVVARPGSTLDAPGLGRFLGERIADYKSPRKVRFLTALPRNPNGKVLKDEVRRLLNEG